MLPTVWDAWSARVAVRAGFRALTIGSHPLADARGAEDGEGQTLDEVLTAVARITAAVDVPVSVDLESGYGTAPQTLIEGLLAAGGVGLNLEDTVHGEGKRLRTSEEHAALIGAVRAAADRVEVPVVINGRTDLFLRHDGDPGGSPARRHRPAAGADRRRGRRRLPGGRARRRDDRGAGGRASPAGQRHRLPRPRRPRAIHPPRCRPDHLRPALPAGAGS